jgi:hypothetical protein
MTTAWRAPMRYVATLRSLKLDYLSTESIVLPFVDETGAVTSFLMSLHFTPRIR